MKNIVFILLLSAICYAQKNSMYLEFTSQIVASSFSFNYERQLFNEPNLLIRSGIGFYGTISILGSSDSYFTFPITLNYLIRLSNDNYIDIGVGPNWIGPAFDSPNASKNILYLFTNVGFRQNLEKNFFWRAHLTPYAINLTKNTYTSGNEVIYIVEKFDFPKIWIGFSIGKRF